MDLLLATTYPEATILSAGPYPDQAEAFVQKAREMSIQNVWRLIAGVSNATAWELRHSPEFLRYQLIRPHVVRKGTQQRPIITVNTTRGLVPAAMTTFVVMPSSTLLSLAYTMFFTDMACLAPLPMKESINEEPVFARELSLYAFESHPTTLFSEYEKRWMDTLLTKRNRRMGVEVETICGQVCVSRLDIRNISRKVNHHFMSSLDGHERKYTLRVKTVNYLHKLYILPHVKSSQQQEEEEGSVHTSQSLAPLPAYYHFNNRQYSSVYLVRQHDDEIIPYEHIFGITLITVLRLNLEMSQRKAAYSLFLKLPLYEDMAPWNIHVAGAELSYIDYDTREVTFDQDVVKVYRILEVLMNFKRTISDFHMCGEKAGNPVYNFEVISECVNSQFKGPCKDLNYPIACGDGTCQSDYVSCLRSIDRKEEEGQLEGKYMTPMRLYLRK